MQARAVTEADLAAWRSRLPLLVPRVALPVALGCLVGVSIGVNTVTQATTTAEQTLGWSSPADAAAYGAVIAAVVMLPLRPRPATWAAAAASLVMAADPMLPWLRVWWLAAAAVAALVGVLDGAGAARQAVVAAGWGEPVVPDVPEPVRRRALRWRAVPVLVGLAALVGVAVSVGFWDRDRAAAEHFRAGAVVGDGVVTAVDPSDGWVDVAVGDRTIRASPGGMHYDVGRPLAVRYSPDGTRAELVEQASTPPATRSCWDWPVPSYPNPSGRRPRGSTSTSSSSG